jgi:glycosyltransferase involved in cell wall biosynthesis
MNPRVSVALVTYNQERFVAEALEGVLAQEAPFGVEVVIGDDCSTDLTRQIVSEAARQFPEKVRLVLPNANRGLAANFEEVLRSCRGEYIALLDGDDLWTSHGKLQRQARFLDVHADCVICFHDVSVLLPDGTFCPQTYTAPLQKEISTLHDLFDSNFIATSSAMLRANAIPDLPGWFGTSPWEDWPLFILMAERGNIGFINETMGVYRYHGRGLWSQLDPVTQLEASIAFLLEMDERLDRRYTAWIQASVSNHRTRLIGMRDPERSGKGRSRV